jgi:uncharacterized protein with HEPN domain
VYNRALADIIRSNGEAVLDYIAEMQDADELFASANTLAAIRSHLLVMARSLADLPPLVYRQLPHVDWRGWQALYYGLSATDHDGRDEIWYAVCALVPATLVLLEHLRQRRPVLFEIGY